MCDILVHHHVPFCIFPFRALFLVVSPFFFLFCDTGMLRSLQLLDLDSDSLLCIAREVCPDDWLPLAMACRSLNGACRMAYTERHPLSQGVEWRTSASANEKRLTWAVDCMGYRPDQITLRNIAFRGDVALFRKVWTEWRPDAGLPERAPLMYSIFRHAGASGNGVMIDEVIKWMPTDELDDTRGECVQEVLSGLVHYDRVDNFLVRWMEMTNTDYDVLMKLVPTCIAAGTERMLQDVLLPALHSHDVTRTDVLRWLHDAVGKGRAPIVKVLFERYACGPGRVVNDSLWHYQLMLKALPKEEDDALREWTAYDFDDKDFKPVDHFATFRVLCETMRIPVPEVMIHACLRKGNTEVIEYIHLHVADRTHPPRRRRSLARRHVCVRTGPEPFSERRADGKDDRGDSHSVRTRCRQGSRTYHSPSRLASQAERTLVWWWDSVHESGGRVRVDGSAALATGQRRSDG